MRARFTDQYDRIVVEVTPPGCRPGQEVFKMAPLGLIGPRRRRRIGIALAALTLMVAQIAPAARAAVDEGWVDDAVRFRESVGLNAGRAFVRSTFEDDTYSADAFGVPLSRDEVEAIHDRQGRSALAMDANKWAYEQPRFAGVWADQSRDGMIVYQFTEGISAAKEHLDTLLPGKIRYEVVRVDRSLEELRALKGRIAKEADSLGSEGVSVSSVGLSIRGNAVVVGVEGNVERSRDHLHSRFGVEVKVRFENLGSGDTCSGLRNCLPLKGGIRVFDGQGSGDCTSGYIAKKPNGQYALVTAGHCIKLGSQGNNWKHISGGDVLGSADVNNSVWCCTDSGNSGADIGFFTIDTEDEPSNKSKAMVNHANPTVDSIRADLPDYAPQQQEGEVVCRMGHGSIDQDDEYSGYTPKKCGEIVNVDTEKKSCVSGQACRWVDHLNVFEGDSTGGDSGGIVFVDVPGQGDEVYLLGTHVHSSDDNPGADGNIWYELVAQGVWEILDRHNLLLDPCTLNDPC